MYKIKRKFSALLTDIHIGPTVTTRRVERIVQETNMQHVDIVALVGDIGDGLVVNLKERAMPLADLRSKYGIFYVTGLVP